MTITLQNVLPEIEIHNISLYSIIPKNEFRNGLKTIIEQPPKTILRTVTHQIIQQMMIQRQL